MRGGIQAENRGPWPRARPCLLLALLALAGCATLRSNLPRPPPSHEQYSANTTLAQAFAPREAEHPGQSGVAILERGPLAWLSRETLADVAEHSIDAQYYIYSNDQTGLVLLEHLVEAADRGVHVRILLDDNNLAPGRDVELASLDRHPNIEVRVFNPSPFRESWLRRMQYLTNLSRANHRMHNKMYVVDGEVAIVGGRNIADTYFNFDPSENYTDLDLLVAGPAARSLVDSFDAYWNSPWAYSAQALVAAPPSDAQSQQMLATLKASAGLAEEQKRGYAIAKRDYLDSLLQAPDELEWSEVEVVVDDPDKIDPDQPHSPHHSPSRVAARISQAWEATEQELLIESAYFVPRAAGMAQFAELRRRGVSITVLTNSLSSTDVPAVHAGYRERRHKLLKMGVHLYEFERTALPNQAAQRHLHERAPDSWVEGRSSAASLHTKLMVFDRALAWVGSYNVDPRSHFLNTEVGLMVHSPAIAGRLAEIAEGDLAPDRSWKVTLDPQPDGTTQLTWTGVRQGQLVTLHHEPDATWELRAWVAVLSDVPGLDSFL
jgi:cardiolipin synthase C